MLSRNPKTVTDNCKPQFSGHETFPLRQLWLAKFARLLRRAEREGQKAPLNGTDAIVELGVGKNMVASMRFWAKACGIVDAEENLTELGKLVFGGADTNGIDPYCASMATVWLLHWNLASKPDAFTPIWYLFNCINQPTLDREGFTKGMAELSEENGWRTTALTLRRAQECVLRSYLPRMAGKGHTEDFIEPLLAGLNLLETTDTRDVFAIPRAARRSLPDEIFVYALLEYWESLPVHSASIDFTRIAYDFGAPGRVFKLDPDSIVLRLQRLSELTDGALEWTEQAGLRQIIRRRDALSRPKSFALEILRKAYKN